MGSSSQHSTLIDINLRLLIVSDLIDHIDLYSAQCICVLHIKYDTVGLQPTSWCWETAVLLIILSYFDIKVL